MSLDELEFDLRCIILCHIMIFVYETTHEHIAHMTGTCRTNRITIRDEKRMNNIRHDNSMMNSFLRKKYVARWL